MIDFCIYLTREKHDPKVYLAVYNNGKCTYVSKDLSGNPEVLYKKLHTLFTDHYEEVKTWDDCAVAANRIVRIEWVAENGRGNNKKFC